jgi:predicted RND superfamily exporter protein
LVPNLVPLIITAGIMGFFGIPLKPSTILIFSIAMGISSDQTIYFITRYRHELRNTGKSISVIVSDTIRETGVSMIFIATVLFFGFGVFVVSKFGGTQALGILLSITLLVAMISNLTLLPAFLLTFEKGQTGIN